MPVKSSAQEPGCMISCSAWEFCEGVKATLGEIVVLSGNPLWFHRFTMNCELHPTSWAWNPSHLGEKNSAICHIDDITLQFFLFIYCIYYASKINLDQDKRPWITCPGLLYEEHSSGANLLLLDDSSCMLPNRLPC